MKKQVCNTNCTLFNHKWKSFWLPAFLWDNICNFTFVYIFLHFAYIYIYIYKEGVRKQKNYWFVVTSIATTSFEQIHCSLSSTTPNRT